MKKTASMILCAAMLAAGGAAPASTVERAHGGYVLIGEARDWKAIGFGAGESGRPGVCAIYARPERSRIFRDDAAVDMPRGERAAFLTWEDGRVAASGGVASFMIGAPVAPLSPFNAARVDDGEPIRLFGDGDRLYAYPEDDARLATAMRAGRSITVTAEIVSGEVAEDVYSLMGVQASTRTADGACR